VHSKTRLSEHVYEEDQLKDSNVMEVYINRLRQYFGKDFIETRRGQGYQLAPELAP
jgi:DNA-binding response OmpR family regulator